jgi:hypothetical protein
MMTRNRFFFVYIRNREQPSPDSLRLVTFLTIKRTLRAWSPLPHMRETVVVSAANDGVRACGRSIKNSSSANFGLES